MEALMQNLFGQFNDIVRALQATPVRYAVVGGVATTIYGGVRTTRDIDFLVHPDDVEEMIRVLVRLGYHANPQSIEFRNSGLAVRRLWKAVPDNEDILMLDLLLARQPMHRRMLRYAQRKQWDQCNIRVVRPADLITMKLARNSATDRVDIEALKRAIEK
jgi:hypothetical protein